MSCQLQIVDLSAVLKEGGVRVVGAWNLAAAIWSVQEPAAKL